MKILIDLQGAQSESRLRGIGRQALSLAKAMIAAPRGHDISVLLNARLDANLVDLTEELAPLLTRGRLVTFRPPGAVAERNPDNLWRTRAAERMREALIAQLRPDLVHVSSLFEGFVDDAVTSVGELQTTIATAVTLHDLIPLADAKRYLRQEGPRRHWMRRAQALKRADLLLSVSEASRREAITRLHIDQKRIAVIAAGADPRFRPATPGDGDETRLRVRYGLDRPFILFVGAIDARKNVRLLLEAFARLPDDVRDRHGLVFAGSLFDADVRRLRRLASLCRVPPDSLRFCLHVPDRDLVRLYQACAAFVFPSRNEGFGLPVLEAMACGAPVLAADAASLPEVVGDPGLLFDPRDPADLTAKLRDLLLDPGSRARAQASGPARASLFTWANSAERAWSAIEHFAERRGQVGQPSQGLLPGRRIAPRLRLAFVSPLPPDASGIAGYSAALLRELGRFYDIHCFRIEAGTTDAWVDANCPVHDIAAFERAAAGFDRIVYSIGNSHFHAPMLGLLERFPGVVILHDVFLSDLICFMGFVGPQRVDVFVRELYRSHGLAALIDDRDNGRLAAVDRYACNGIVFRAGLGVIVHSAYAADSARLLHGPGIADRLTLVPHLKALPADIGRRAARSRLGLQDGDLLVCSFGVITRRKCSLQLIRAWQASTAARSAGARLVLVGEVSEPLYGAEIEAEQRGSTAVVAVTGYANEASYRDYIAAADIAVQLRTTSRGETSGAILDCLAAGTAVVANRHGAAADYSSAVLVPLPDAFTEDEVAAAIDALANDPVRREAVGNAGRAHVLAHHDPGRVGALVADAIERASARSDAGDERALLDTLATIEAGIGPDHADLRNVADEVADMRPPLGASQILYDVTVLGEHDARTGIQRVVRAMLHQLVSREIPGYRLEPVRMDGSVLRYARDFTWRVLGVSSALPDEVCTTGPGDIYLSVDWVPDRLPQVEAWLAAFRRRGGRVVIGVHDLLPLQLPQFFPDFMPRVTRRWFETSLRVADQFVCVSATVADEVARQGHRLLKPGFGPIGVDVVHNAAGLVDSLPSTGRPADAAAALREMASRPTFLMVGTIEPRKGHAQVLAGFDLLWREGLNVGLVMVGKQGWMMDELAGRVSLNPERGRRLTWVSQVSDEYLADLYGAATALIAASEGEGFGLPLVEAGEVGTALIARDIPVFREVAEGHAFFFEGLQPADLAEAIRRWLDLHRRGEAPSPAGMPIQTWQQSADELVRILVTRGESRLVIPARSTDGAQPDA